MKLDVKNMSLLAVSAVQFIYYRKCCQHCKLLNGNRYFKSIYLFIYLFVYLFIVEFTLEQKIKIWRLSIFCLGCGMRL
jgi:hypothetical protein